MGFFGIFRRRLELYLSYFNKPLLWQSADKKMEQSGSFKKKVQRRVLAINSAGVWTGPNAASLTTAQTLVLNRRKMSVPCWDTGGLTFLQWKRLKVRRKSYSHIDYFLTNNYITHKIIDPAIHAISISDHVLISITFIAEHQPLPPPR